MCIFPLHSWDFSFFISQLWWSIDLYVLNSTAYDSSNFWLSFQSSIKNFEERYKKKNKHHTIKPPWIINSLILKFQILLKIIEILVILAKEKKNFYFSLCRLHRSFCIRFVPKTQETWFKIVTSINFSYTNSSLYSSIRGDSHGYG